VSAVVLAMGALITGDVSGLGRMSVAPAVSAPERFRP